MTDILKEKLEKEKLVEVETWVCDICERHFITIKSMPAPTFCPYCGIHNISSNDELEIKIS